jgi:hypothetical protein
LTDNEIDIGRESCGHGSLRDHAFSEATEPILATNPVTAAEPRYLIAAGDHHAGGVCTWDVGQR